MTANSIFPKGRRICAALLVGTVLGSLASPAFAQSGPTTGAPPTAVQAPPPAAAVPPAPARTILSVTVSGNQRLEPETVLSYTALRAGENYDNERLDHGAAGTCSRPNCSPTCSIAGADTGNLVIQVRENPVINRIVLEGNRRIKDDKITPEIRLAPRQIFTRSRARADVARIIELYRRQGRYAASVEPQIVQLDQNRVDVVFEISEGPRSRVRRINIIGNEAFRRRPPDPGNGDPRARLVQYLQLARHLRSRSPRLRPAEAQAILPDPGLCRFPRRLGGRRADSRTGATSSSPMSSRRVSATNSARSRSKATFAISAPTGCARTCRCTPATGTTPSRSRTRSPA